MTESPLIAALSRGVLVVTPNKRLARDIGAQHDRAQLAAGRRTWPAARAMPWHTWVGELTEVAQDAELDLPRHRLDEAQVAELWQSIVARDLDAFPLVDAAAAAALAAEAWERVNAWGAGGESWRGFSDEGPDAAQFVRWAERFVGASARLDAIEGARAADAVARVASGLPAVASMDVVLAGFIEHSPQQQRLFDALVRRGANVTEIAPPPAGNLAQGARLARTASPRDELVRALDWARRKAEADPAARIGIVVLDLAERSDLVRALAEERLCPALQWPGQERKARPYDISLAPALSSVALVAAALDFLRIEHGPLDREQAAVLVRSPYLPDAGKAWMKRSALERDWLRSGTAKVPLESLIASLEQIDEPLAQRWRNARRSCRIPARASPRHWAEHWRGWLDAVGWLEGTKLDSDEYQALGAWNRLVAEFARLAAVTPELSGRNALATLVRLADGTSFQPESTGARVHILGLMEAAGLAFDALWVAGFAADAWPQGASPNPLLPIRWQRERGVPRSHPARELDFARRMTAMLSFAAPEVVFSYAARADDHERAPSPLVASLTSLDDECAEATGSPARRMFDAPGQLDRVPDWQAPPLPAGSRLRGGAQLIQAQTDCPFQAAARYRLDADNWPSEAYGITRLERGNLVHATLAALWRALGDQATLVALSDDALDACIAEALSEAWKATLRERQEPPPASARQAEDVCVKALVRRWLVEIDAQRAPFTVTATERALDVAIADCTLQVRLDRWDALADGGTAIIDYKTGKAGSLGRWFAARPSSPQLALYAVGLEQAEASKPVRALAYGHVRPGEVKVVGIADDAELLPGLKLPRDVKGAPQPDWLSAMQRLRDAAIALVEDFGAGRAGVLPRNGEVCKRCRLHALCRIGERGTTGDDLLPTDEEGAGE